MGKKEDNLAKARANVGAVDRVAGVTEVAPGVSIVRDARVQGVTRTKDHARIEVGRIVADPGQPRKTFDAEPLTRLAMSLKSRGQLQPIRVRWDEGAGNYVVVVGERRWRAAQEAELTHLECIVHDRPLTEGELRLIQIQENLLREEAEGMRALMEEGGFTQARLADELGFSQASIARGLALLGLAPEVQSRVIDGTLTAAAAYPISQLETAEEQAEVAAEAVAGDLRSGDVQEIVRKRKAAGKGKGGGDAKGKGGPKAQTNRVFNTGVRIKFTAESKKGFDVLSLLEASREVTRKLEEEAGSLAESVA